jgi:hypothetical protein
LIDPQHSSLRRLAARIGCLWPGVGAALGVGGVILLAGIGALARPGRLVLQPATPAVSRIPAPTATATPLAPTPTAAAPTAVPTGGDAGVSIGDLVEVFGTEGDGVRLRSAPSLEGVILGIAGESEVFEVRDGPVEASGYIWWNLVNPYSPERSGWAVATFLRPLPGY